jgi:phosphoribosylamine-glycine ligase
MPTKSIPIETENETELIERLHERSISLVILVQPRALESETCNLLIAKGIQVFGHGNRILTLKGDTLRSMLDRYHIPRLAWSPVASTTEALAFATAHKAPWRLEARRLRPDEDAFFTDSAALERFLSAHPGIFDDPQPVTILTGEVARDYAVIAVCDRACMRMLGCAELAILAADNDTGPATPGCGAFAPAFPADHPVLRRINTRILGRLHAALRRVGITWHGFVTLRLHITSEGQPLLQDLTFGLLSPESDAILSAASRDLLSLCLTALRDELEEAEQSIETENNAIAIVFSGASQPPAAPAGASIIPYPNDAERSFSLICLRKRMEETIHTAYLAALPIIRTGQVHCRQDIGGRTLLARESGRRLRVRLLGISGFRRIYAWLLGPSSHSGRKRP